MEYGCDNTSVPAIGDVVFKISCTERKLSSIGFADDIADKYITIGDDMTNIYLPNITVTDKLNHTPIIHGDDNYLISTEQVHEFCVAVQNIHKCHGGRNYVHA